MVLVLSIWAAPLTITKKQTSARPTLHKTGAASAVQRSSQLEPCARMWTAAPVGEYAPLAIKTCTLKYPHFQALRAQERRVRISRLAAVRLLLLASQPRRAWMSTILPKDGPRPTFGTTQSSVVGRKRCGKGFRLTSRCPVMEPLWRTGLAL